jgi:peroxiredoxin
MKIVADSLSVKFPDVPLVKSFVNDARSAERRYYSMLGLQKKLKEAKTELPDIELPDPQGNLAKLSSLKGKTVILYFWSPVSEDLKIKNQDLIQTYQIYKSRGLEIFAVGLSADVTAWANTIIFDKLTWKNVIEQDVSNSTLYSRYNINKIPTNFLINKEGDIVARDLYGSELRVWLDNIIK